MKKSIKLLALVLCLALAVSALAIFAACGNKTDGYKIGVLVADASGEEALAFKAYFTNYIAKQYNVEFVYSAALEDNAGAKAQAEAFIGQNCKAIIDMADKDRAGIAKLCNDNKVYYAIASGVLSDEDWATCKSYQYFLGQVGPDSAAEYAAGLAMGQYYKNTKHVTKVAIYGAFIPNPMHVYRLAGLLTGLGDTYKSKSSWDMVGDLFASQGTIAASDIAGSVAVSYFGGYDPTTIYDTLGAILAEGVDAVLSVGMATTFFSDMLNSSVEFSDIDSFTATNGTSMNTGKLGYLAGKYASSIGPVFALIQSAINGAPIRDKEGNAVSFSQGYKVATNYTEFQACATADQGETPIYNKTLLDTIISTKSAPVTEAAFKAVVDAH